MAERVDKRKILAAGRGLNPVLIRYFSRMTGKVNPDICLLPTASGDHPEWIEKWMALGAELGFRPQVQPLFISSFTQEKDFADVLLNVDAIYVGGGNTVNMLAIWREHGIMDLLKQAWEQGVVLGGGSAGGICWFEHGLTDSRPRELTAMQAMGGLKGSFAPHYLSEPGRRQNFHKYILNGQLSDGFACDDTTALEFSGTTLVRVVGSTPDARAYEVRKSAGDIAETELQVLYVGD